jgi:hypothetical protein
VGSDLSPRTFVAPEYPAAALTIVISKTFANLTVLRPAEPLRGSALFLLYEAIQAGLTSVKLRRVGLRIQRYFPMDPYVAASIMTDILPATRELHAGDSLEWHLVTLQRMGQRSGWTLNEQVQAAQRILVNLQITTPPGSVRQEVQPAEAGLIWDLDIYQEANSPNDPLILNDDVMETLSRTAEAQFDQWRTDIRAVAPS